MLGTMGVEVKLPKVKKSRIRKLRNSLASDIDNHDDEDAAHFADISSLEARLPPENTWIRCGYLKKCVFAQEKTWQDRRVVLCKDFLFLERLGDRRVIETIPLFEIERVDKHVYDEDHFVEQTKPNAMKSWGEDRKQLQRSGSRSAAFNRLGSDGKSWNPMASLPRPGSSKFSGSKGKKSPMDTLSSTFGRSKSPEQQRDILMQGSFNRKIIAFEIYTRHDGMLNGRTYRLRCDSDEDCNRWVNELRKTFLASVADIQKSQAQHTCGNLKKQARSLYHSTYMQSLIAFLILCNFVTSIIDAEWNPEQGSTGFKTIEAIDIAFTALFTMELVLNLFSHWWKPFLSDSWNLLDTVVVVASLVSIPLSNIPSFNVLRLFRVFRVMRLFKRLGSVRVLLRALGSSMMPVINAFFILFIITCLYSVIAVVLFGSEDEGLSKTYFGNFSSSLFTMFQALICPETVQIYPETIR